ncbi:Uncharacterised protein [Mycobacteroides abscessus subsp. abscessus]|nr:Uncharacterised protein [Mycobacteroides abscessus subsp. abscessus]
MGNIPFVDRICGAYISLAFTRDGKDHAAVRRVKVHGLFQRKSFAVEYKMDPLRQLR